MKKGINLILRILTISAYVYLIMFVVLKINYIRKISILNSVNLTESFNIRNNHFYIKNN